MGYFTVHLLGFLKTGHTFSIALYVILDPNHIIFRMNEKKPKWVCPVCNKPAYYEHLFLDGFYIQLLLSPKFKALTTNEIILNNDASWEAVEETALGVSDSDDDYSEPPPKKALTNSKVSVDDDDDISVIPIAEMVDKDGAPILTDTAIPSNIPVNTFLASNMSSGNSSSNSVTISNNSVNNSLSKQVSLDDDLDPKRAFPQELDYMDWNYSVKFFQFLREPPPDYRKSPTPPPPSPKEDSKSIQSSEVSDSGSSSIKIADKFAYNKRGRGRGGRGGRGRGGSRNNKNDTEDDEDEIPAKPVNGGRGRARGRGRGGRAKTNVSNSKRRRVAESSEVEMLNQIVPIIFFLTILPQIIPRMDDIFFSTLRMYLLLRALVDSLSDIGLL